MLQKIDETMAEQPIVPQITTLMPSFTIINYKGHSMF